MARWAIGDVQGCCEELQELLALIRFSSDRDCLWLVGDLVNRGPCSLQVLRLVRSLGDNAITVLGNHDLHLLAVALSGAKQRSTDTLSAILAAPDRDKLLEWLLQRPLAHYQETGETRETGGAMRGDLLLHAGVLPQWSLSQTLELANDVHQALQTDAPALLSQMYGDRPNRWQASLSGPARLRLAINVLTRIRFCTPDGRIDLTQKGRPESAHDPWIPWFEAPARASRQVRIVFGHWSALGFYRAAGLLGLDTGCVWGGELTAINLDEPAAEPISVASRQPHSSAD